MLDDYQIPATALIGVLLIAYVYLYARVRSVRTLLWLFGIACTEVYAIFFWRVTMTLNPVSVNTLNIHTLSGNPLLPWPFHGTIPPSTPWMTILGQTTLMVASAFFLASLSPLTFRFGQRRILFVIPYIAPLLIYTVLIYGPLRHPRPDQTWIFLLLASAAIAVAFVWSLQDNVIPIWLSELIVLVAAAICVWLFYHGNVYWPLWIGISGNLLMTALLVVFTYRRATPGVIFAVVGLAIWAIPPFMGVQADAPSGFMVALARAWILSKVLLAVGLLLLAMEDEIERNFVAGHRERRIRTELAAYAQQQLTARSLAQFEAQSSSLCAMIAAQSRFSRAVLVLRNRSGHLSAVGSAGMDGATLAALDSVLDQMPFDALTESLPIRVPDTAARDLDLRPWLKPGDDLEQMHQTRFTAILIGAPDPDGAILLAGEREAALAPDDLLPLQILAERLGAARAQSFTLGRLIDAERSASSTLLATRLVQQMHNPLTVILGYGSLLQETVPAGLERTAADALLIEARRMRATMDRLTQLTREHSERYTEFSIEELLADVEQLHRADFLRETIEYTLRTAAHLPRLYGNPHRIRQALMYAMQASIDALQNQRNAQQKAISISVVLHGDRVRLELRHSGRRIAHPERVFHALDSGAEVDVAAGIGLSLCAEILRECGGTVAARNLDPQGVQLTLDVPVREAPPSL